MPDIALDKCSLLAVFVESVLWGLLFAMYLIAVFLLLQKTSSVGHHAPYLVLAAVMLVLCTTHVSLSFARLVDAFFRSPDPSAYLGDITAVTFRFKSALLFVEVFIGNLLIVFRCFTHWNQNYGVALVPALLAVGTLLSAAGASHAMSAASRTALIFDGQVRSWLIAALALALATQGICLFLVLARVRKIHASVLSHVNRHVMIYTLMVVCVDSGAFAFLTSAVLLCTFVARKNAQYIVGDALAPIMAITFLTIIAGMTIKLSNPGPAPAAAAAAARAAWPHRSPTSPASRKVQWHDFEEDPEAPTTSSSEGQGLSRATGSMQHENKSTGTLNLTIVI